MALKRINKELTDLGRYVGPHKDDAQRALSQITPPRNILTSLLRLQEALTDNIYSDPPSSCSAGPIGEDLVCQQRRPSKIGYPAGIVAASGDRLWDEDED